MKLRIQSLALVVFGVLFAQQLVAAELLVTKVYNVGLHRRSMAPLKEVITRCVQPNSWKHLGGPASIAEAPNAHIVVRHTATAHKEIASLLAALKKLPEPRARMKSEKPVPAITVSPGAGADLQVVVYDVYDLVHKPTGDDYDSLIDEVTKLHGDSWDEAGGPGSLAIFQSRGALIVLQTASVHHDVAEFFKSKRESN